MKSVVLNEPVTHTLPLEVRNSSATAPVPLKSLPFCHHKLQSANGYKNCGFCKGISLISSGVHNVSSCFHKATPPPTAKISFQNCRTYRREKKNSLKALSKKVYCRQSFYRTKPYDRPRVKMYPFNSRVDKLGVLLGTSYLVDPRLSLEDYPFTKRSLKEAGGNPPVIHSRFGLHYPVANFNFPPQTVSVNGVSEAPEVDLEPELIPAALPAVRRSFGSVQTPNECLNHVTPQMSAYTAQNDDKMLLSYSKVPKPKNRPVRRSSSLSSNSCESDSHGSRTRSSHKVMQPTVADKPMHELRQIFPAAKDSRVFSLAKGNCGNSLNFKNGITPAIEDTEKPYECIFPNPSEEEEEEEEDSREIKLKHCRNENEDTALQKTESTEVITKAIPKEKRSKLRRFTTSILPSPFLSWLQHKDSVSAIENANPASHSNEPPVPQSLTSPKVMEHTYINVGNGYPKFGLEAILSDDPTTKTDKILVGSDSKSTDVTSCSKLRPWTPVPAPRTVFSSLRSPLAAMKFTPRSLRKQREKTQSTKALEVFDEETQWVEGLSEEPVSLPFIPSGRSEGRVDGEKSRVTQFKTTAIIHEERCNKDEIEVGVSKTPLAILSINESVDEGGVRKQESSSSEEISKLQPTASVRDVREKTHFTPSKLVKDFPHYANIPWITTPISLTPETVPSLEMSELEAKCSSADFVPERTFIPINNAENCELSKSNQKDIHRSASNPIESCHHISQPHLDSTLRANSLTNISNPCYGRMDFKVTQDSEIHKISESPQSIAPCTCQLTSSTPTDRATQAFRHESVSLPRDPESSAFSPPTSSTLDESSDSVLHTPTNANVSTPSIGSIWSAASVNTIIRNPKFVTPVSCGGNESSVKTLRVRSANSSPERKCKARRNIFHDFVDADKKLENCWDGLSLVSFGAVEKENHEAVNEINQNEENLAANVKKTPLVGWKSRIQHTLYRSPARWYSTWHDGHRKDKDRMRCHVSGENSSHEKNENLTDYSKATDTQWTCSKSDTDVQGTESGGSSTTGSGRKRSLTRHPNQRPDRAAPSDSEQAGGGESRGGSSEGAPSEAGDRVQTWATSFEKLLEDPVGLHTFTEFLRKEYSHENIYFWTACERYRLGITADTSGNNNNNNADSNKPWSEWSGKHAAAKTIYNNHLGDNAPEPVNVDAQARQMAHEGLRQPTQDLFAAAQKQVFSLMKFDSYSRFLKSALYEECLEREARGEDIQFGSQESLDPNLMILPSQFQHSSAPDAQNSNNFSKGKTELEERRRRSLLPWHRSKDRSKSKDRLLSGGAEARNGAASKNKRSLTTAVGAKDSAAAKAKSLSVSASRLVRGTSSDATPTGAGVRSNSVSRVVNSRNASESSGSIGKTSDVSGSRTSLNSGCEGTLLAGRKAVSKESLTSSDCVSLSGGEGSGGCATGRCRVVLPDRSQSVVAVRAGVSVDRVMRRLMDRRGLAFLAYNVVMAGKGDRLVSATDDSSVLCGAEVRLQQLVLFRLDLPNQKTVCVKAKPHKLASDVLRPILAKYGFKLDLMHIHTAEDNPRPVNVKSQITELDGQKFIVQTKEDVKEWGVSGVSNGVGGAGSAQDSDALDAITNRVFEDLLQSKTSHQLLANCDYDARSAKTEACSDYSGGVCGSLGRHSALPGKARDVSAAARNASNTSTGNRSLSSPTKDNDAELYEGLKRAQMSRIEDQRGTKINSELPDFLKCDSENKENEMSVDEPDEENPHFLPPDPATAASVSYFNNTRTTDHQHLPFYSQHHHHHHFHYTPASQHQSHHTQHCPTEETCAPDEPSQFLPSTTTSLQPSSSSLTQHQAHHNFWSDISGGGSSIPSSLLATSSSSLSSSTGLPMSSSTNFDGIDTPLTIASNFLLDMHYDTSELSTARAKLRPRPESCVNTRPDALMRPDQANRPKSSCGSLTASPDRTLLAPPDLDKTLSSSTSMDQTGDVFSDIALRGAEAEESGRLTRLQAPLRPVMQQQLRGSQFLRRHDHHHSHPSPLDCVMSQLVSSGAGGLASSHLSDFSTMVNSVDAGTTSAAGISARVNANAGGPFNGNMSTPPPPLPPKPKLGAPARGPPPRPPSRQLPLGPPSSSGFVAGLLDGSTIKLRGPGPAEMSSNQKLQGKDTVSFV